MPQDGPQGRRVRLAAGGYEAEISEVGASLAVLRDRYGHLVVPAPVDRIRPGYSGAVLAPWTNRLRDGRYEYGGSVHQLPLNEPDRGTAAHGLVAWDRWELLEHRPGGRGAESAWADFGLEPAARPGYPFSLRLRVRYALDADGLHVGVATRNTGPDRAPYAVAGHPYLVAPAGHVDDWELTVPARTWVRTDPQRLLPLGIEPVDGTVHDLRAGRRLGGISLDVALGELERDEQGRCDVVLRDAQGQGVVLQVDDSVRCLQVFTDGPGEAAGPRRGVAVEPMTGPADNFNSGECLVHLRPGGTHSMCWSLRRLFGHKGLDPSPPAPPQHGAVG